MRGNLVTILTECLPIISIEMYILLTWEKKIANDQKMILLLLVLLMAVTVFGAKMACLGSYKEVRKHRDHAQDKFLRIFSLGKHSNDLEGGGCDSNGDSNESQKQGQTKISNPNSRSWGNIFSDPNGTVGQAYNRGSLPLHQILISQERAMSAQNGNVYELTMSLGMSGSRGYSLESADPTQQWNQDISHPMTMPGIRTQGIVFPSPPLHASLI